MGFFRTNPVGAPMVVQKLRPKIYSNPWTTAWRRQRVDEVMKILAISNSMEVIQIQEDSDLSLCAEPIVHLFQGLRLLCFIFFNKFIQIVFILSCESYYIKCFP